MLPMLPAVAAAIWSVWTWREEQQRERRSRRDQEAALYVNVFLATTEELQHRLYAILDDDHLQWDREQHGQFEPPASSGAIELLYRIAVFSGWGHRMFRYGPYTRDARFIQLLREIGATFSDRKIFAGDAFRIGFDERLALGEAVIYRVGEVNSALPVFETLALHQFERDVRDPAGPNAALYARPSVQRLLQAYDEALQGGDLRGRDRLAVLQNLLVDMARYLETQEGFKVAIGRRHKVAMNLPVESEQIRLVHQTRGRMRLAVPQLERDPGYAAAIRGALEGMTRVTSVRISAAAGSVVIGYEGESAYATVVLRVLQERLGRPALGPGSA